MRGVETEWLRLGNVAKDTETVLQGLKVMQRIMRLWRSYSEAHGDYVPHPSHNQTNLKNFVDGPVQVSGLYIEVYSNQEIPDPLQQHRSNTQGY